MLSEFLTIIGTLSPSTIYAELRALRVRANRSQIKIQREAGVASSKHSVKLWTLRDCQMELLTEGTMHAFEARVTPYAPAPRSSNYQPGRGLRRDQYCWTEHANVASHLLRTLERRPDMLPEGAPAIYRNGPQIEEGPEQVLSYIGQALRSDNQTNIQ
jgi:hypothetical protein